MSIDPKKILESLIRNKLPEDDDSQVVKFTRSDAVEDNYSLSAYRDESGAVTGVTYQVSEEGRDIVFNSRDEVVICDRASVRYYRFDGNKPNYKEHISVDGLSKNDLDASTMEADRALMESARRMYLAALEEPELFDVKGFFEE